MCPYLCRDWRRRNFDILVLRVRNEPHGQFSKLAMASYRFAF